MPRRRSVLAALGAATAGVAVTTGGIGYAALSGDIDDQAAPVPDDGAVSQSVAAIHEAGLSGCFRVDF